MLNDILFDVSYNIFYVDISLYMIYYFIYHICVNDLAIICLSLHQPRKKKNEFRVGNNFRADLRVNVRM